jgi:hypothetical protein
VAQTEPSFYIYRGQPKPLALDVQHIAVRVRASDSATDLPALLTSRGFTSADIETRPLPQWLLLRAHDALGAARTNGQTAAPPSIHPAAAAIHQLLSSLVTSADPNLDFVSPVFRDGAGNLVLITSRILNRIEAGFSRSGACPVADECAGRRGD